MAKDYNPDIVSVVDEEGKEHIFEELDRIETDRGHYVALLPIYDDTEEILEGEDEVLPLKVIEEDGETYLTMIEDDDEFEEVYQASGIGAICPCTCAISMSSSVCTTRSRTETGAKRSCMPSVSRAQCWPCSAPAGWVV